MENLQERYEKLKKKHNLPEFEELQKEFGISNIEEEPILLEIIKKIDDKIELFIKTLNRILQPDTAISDIQESGTFSEAEKKEIFETYKQLMVIHNNAMLLIINPDEKEEALFISQTFKQWPEIRKAMADTVTMMRDSWKQDIDLKEDIGYMG